MFLRGKISYFAAMSKPHTIEGRYVTNTINWRFATLFASKCVLGKEFWHAFRERLLLRRALQASQVSAASYDSLANYASLTTFGHIMLHSITFARKHLSIAVRQIILPCARICFLSAPIYGISHICLFERSCRIWWPQVRSV